MYLKRIEMQGFKSFADKISFDFGKGITAIVGPNGCGKSNISDAMRWVMGEQSIKSLRGSKMEDVIFSGTEKRKPQGFAEVTLILDNSQKVFPLEYEEIAVTRRVFRSGESEYMINKAVCRLKDIHELFMDTGLGRDGYSVIGQGKIDEILSNRAEDRRRIFEEAAGISKYKYRKLETASKLAQTEENLVRVADIAGELEGRVEPLRIASEKARKYLDIREQLKKTEVSLAAYNIDRLNKIKEESSVLYQRSLEELDAAKAQAEEMRQKEKELYEEMRRSEGETEELRNRISGETENASQIQIEINILYTNIDNIKENTKKLEAEQKSMQEAEAETTKEFTALCQKRNELQAEKNRVGQQLEECRRTVAEKADRIQDINGEILALQRKQAEAETKAQNVENKKEGMKTLAQNFTRRTEALSAAAELAAQREQAAKEKYDAESKALSDNRKEQQDIQSKLENGLKKGRELKEKIAALKEEYNSKSHTLSQKEARLSTLRDMEKSMEGYSSGVKAVLAARGLGDIRGVLSKLIDVPGKYVSAIEAALGNAAQNIVTGDENDAKRAIEYLKENRGGRATFLPIASVRGTRLDRENELAGKSGFICLACDAVECAPEYKDIVLNLLGRIAVVDNMDSAIKISREFKYSFKIVTLDGEIFAAGGSVTGGSNHRHAQLLGREKEIDSLGAEVAKLQRECDRAEDKIDEGSEELAELSSDITKMQDKLRDLREAAAKSESLCEMHLHLAEREGAEAQRNRDEIDELTAQMNNSDSEKERLDAEAKVIAEELMAAQKETQAARERLRLCAEERNALATAAAEKADELSAAESEIARTDERIRGINDRKEEIYQKIKQCDELMARDAERTAQMEIQIKLKLADKDESVSRAEQFKEELAKRGEQKNSADNRIIEIRSQIDSQNEKIFLLQSESLRFETKITKAQNDVDAQINRLWDDYELTYSDTLELKEEITDFKEARETVASLKAKIRGLGSVNVDAIEEYKQVKERYEYLTGQISDLTKAKEELLKIINDMTRVMTKIFKEQFKIIGEQFKETFRILFGGGEANLSLVDEENVLESGINIDVQPPGKKLQSLLLLSGGERALSAIALLLAILKVRPTPFCVLDEIEAALDDNNIARFAEYLKGYCEKTQFVIITHRRGTMEAADILYGITMQEKGVSKMLAMKLDEVGGQPV